MGIWNKFKTRRQKNNNKPQLVMIEALEPRLLYSVDLLGSIVDDAKFDSSHQEEADAQLVILAKANANLILNTHSQNDGDDAEPHIDAQHIADNSLRIELVIIDSATEDYQRLVDEIINQAGDDVQLEFAVIDSQHNGVEQISEILSQYSGLDALHIVSHGADGQLNLGNTQLSSDNLALFNQEITGWSGSFADDADILLYGCNLAATENGQLFVQSLAQLTQADVAASDDLTGNAELDGDWVLEYQAGEIETGLAVSELLQQEWQITLDIADTLVVTTTADTSDGDTSSVDALIADPGADGHISLREAIIAANNTVNGASADKIHFNISTADAGYVDPDATPGTGDEYWSISVGASGLPYLLDTVILDATTQPGYSGNPVIELDGSATSPGSGINGIALRTNDSTVRGFSVHSFGDEGIEIDGSTGFGDNNIIQNNWIGIDATGAVNSNAENNMMISVNATGNLIGGTGANDGNVIGGAVSGYSGIIIQDNSHNNIIQGNMIGVLADGTTLASNSGNGILIINSSDTNTIGGAIAGAGNVISGNAGDGIRIDNGANNLIQGNFIGTDVTGTVALGNGDDGISLMVNATGNTVGGTTAAERNIISGNDATGVYIEGSGNFIQGNYIGTDVTGALDLGNGNVALEGSIRTFNAGSNVIGGEATGAGNIIAFGGAQGIELQGTTAGISIIGNSIFSNAGIGIDLNDDGVTVNDAGDGDGASLSNNLQNYPLISSAVLTGTDLTLNGLLDTDAATTQYRLDFYGNVAGTQDATNGEGAYYLGTTTVTTDGSGDASFTDVTLSGVTLALGDFVTATATEITDFGQVGVDDQLAYGDTSEFAVNLVITNSIPETAVFQQGVDGYTGTQDTFTEQNSPDQNNGNNITFQTDLFDGGTDGTTQGLIRFDDLFGSGPGQIPFGSTIHSASLTVNVTNTSDPSSQITLHQMLSDWNESSTWNTTGSGVQANDTEASIASDSALGNAAASGAQAFVGLETTLQAWANGATNYGWVILNNTTNGWDASSSEAAVQSERPQLTISYTAPGNVAPTGTTLVVAADEQTLTPIDISGNVADVDGTVVLSTTTVTAGPSNGTLVNNGDGTFDYTGDLNFVGTDSFTYTVEDNEGQVSSDITVTVDVGNFAANTSPINTVPATQTLAQNGMLLFSSATGTQLSISDADAAGASIELTLSATNGTVNLPSTQGLTFSVGDGSGDATMTFTGTIADINAALEGTTFVATPGFTGAASLQLVSNDLGNTGAGGALSDTDTVVINVEVAYQSLLLSTAGDVSSPSGAPGLNTWESGEVLEFGGPNLTFESGTTNGQFSSALDLDAFAGETTVIVDAIHQVGRDISVGAVTPMQLYAGDLILSTFGDHTYTSTNSLTVRGEDTFVFRPDSPGDYSSGTFILLIDKNQTTLGKASGITLVEQDTVVGDVTLNAGDFLYIGDNNKTVERWQPDALGASSSGTVTLFIDGVDIGIDQNIGAIDLIETDTTIGDASLTSGQILLSLLADDSSVGSGTPISTQDTDIFVLDLTTTGTNTAGTATTFFEGADVGLNTTQESVFSFTLKANEAPLISPQTLPAIDENSANGTIVGTVSATDPDAGDTVSYAIVGGNTNGAFAINASTGQLTVANSSMLDFETTPTFNLSVAAIDNNGAYGTETVTVNLNDINDAPVNTVPGAQTVNEDTSLNITGISVSDDDGNLATTQLTVTNGNLNVDIIGGATISGGANNSSTLTLSGTQSQINAALATLAYQGDLNFNGNDTLTVLSTDSDGTPLSDSDDIAITVLSVNDTPVNTVPGAQTVNEDTLLNITGISVNDVDGNLATTQLTVTNGNLNVDIIGGATISGGANNSSTLTLSGSQSQINAALATLAYQGDLNFNGNDTLTVLSTDSDGAPLSDSDDIAITVSSINDAPTGTTLVVAADEETLTAIDISGNVADVDGTVDLSTTAVTSGPSNGTLINNGDGTFDYTGDVDFVGTDSFTYKVEDNNGLASSNITVTINVSNINDVPEITSDGGGATASINIAENTTAVTTVTATDPDLDTPTFSITGGADAARFTIDTNSGELTFITAPNFESPTDVGANNVYEVTVQASDGTASDSQTISVTVTNVVETSAYTIDPISDTNVDENAAFTSVTPSLSGAAPIGSVTYTLTGNDAGLFTVDSSTGVVSMVARDFESPADLNGDNVYEVTLIATDDDGNSDTEAFTVTVNDVIETATYTIDPIADTNVDENDPFTSVTPALSGAAPIGSVTYTLSGNDAGLFTVDSSTGVVSMIARDFESPADLNGDNIYEVTLVATDDDGNSDTEAFTVTVNDVIETAAYTIDPIADTNVNENAAFTSVTPTLSGAAPIGNVTYTLAGNDAGLFTVNSSTGVVSMVARDFESPADLNGDNIYEVTLVATDEDGNSDTEAFTVTVNDVVETVTYTIDPIADTNVDENAAFTSVTPSVSGAAPIGSVTYTLAGNDAGLFTVDSSTGVVSMIARDFESPADLNGDNVYEVTLVATDDDGNSDTEAFTVTVNDVIETATYTIDPISDTNVDENDPFTSVTPSLSGAAPIGSVTYTLSGNDAGLFTVNSSTGVVSMIARDFESPADINGDNIYEVTLVATDDDGNSDTEAFTVTVNDVVETAAYTIDPIADTSVDENAAFTSVTPSLSGAAPIGSVTYTLSGNDAGLFTVNSSTGVVSMIARDFESPADLNGDNIYEVTLVATDDDGNSDTEAFTVTVNDVVETATYTIDPIADTNVNENDPFTSVTPTLAGAAPIGSVTYTLSGNDAGLFTVDSSTGVVSMIARDFESPADLNGDNVYEVTLVATDDDGNSDTEAFTVTVNDVVETATYTIDPISDTSVDENAAFTSVTPTLSGAAPIGSVTYTLSGNDAGLFTVDSSTGVVSMIARDFESPADLNGDNIYEVTLVATDDDGNSDTEAFTVTVNDVIETAAYTIDPIADTNVNENAAFTSVTPTLSGAAPIGNVTYTLAGNDAGLFTVNSSTGVVSMVARDFESPADLNGDNIYEVTLVATDDDGNSDTEAFTVSVNDVVETATYTIDPIADTSVDENAAFTSVTPSLSGAAPIGSVTYTLSGNDAGLFTVNSSTGVVSMIARDFEAPADLNGDNVYEVTLVATDDDGNSDTEAFTVTVNDVVETATYTIDPISDTSVDENAAFTSVTPTLSGAAPIGSVTYTLSGNDAGLFTVNSSTGVVSMIARDFESPADLNGDNVYEVTLVATDNDSNSDTEAFTVTVNDVVETATYTIDPISDTNVDENAPFTSVTPALSGAAPIGSVTYTLAGNDAGLFTVDSSTGVVSMIARDFESPADLNGDNVYEVTLVATDDDGNSDSEAFTVTVNDVVETAAYSIDPIADTNVDENAPFTSVTPTLAGAAPIGSVTYTLSGNDAGLFTVDSSSGVVSMIARDFESPADLNGDNVYEVTLVATDDDGNSDTEAFTVTVNDVVETAAYTIDPIADTNVDENAPFTSVTPTLAGAAPIGSVTYTLAGNDAGLFTVDSGTGVVSMIARDFESPADLNGDNVYEVTLVATDNDSNSDTEAFTVTVNDVVETAAYTIDPIADTSVDENAAFTSVTPSLSGAAPIGSVTYTLSGNDAGLFTVDSSTGVVSMIARDFEAPADLNGDNVYEVTLVATDDDGNSDTEAFTVTVNDVVETATYTIDPISDTSVDENAAFTSVTPSLSGAAPIGSVTYTLSGNDAGLFTVDSSTGVVSMIARDFEAPADLNGDNVYEVTLVATDDDGNSDTEAFTVTVNDVVETATYTIDPISDTSVDENAAFTSVTPSLSGAAPIGSVTYTLSGNDAGLFTVDSSTGVVSMIARDFEAPADLNGDNVYEVTLVATDDDGNSDTEAFTVTVNDVVETATYSIDPIADTNVDENDPFTSVTPTLAGAAPIGSVTYTLSGNDAGLFTVDSSTGVVSMIARDFESPADLNGDNVYEVTLVATDDDGNSNTEAFTVTVNDVIETAAYTIEPISDTNVDENDPFTSVTPTLAGAAPIGSVTYTLAGNDAGLFTVDSSTGVVSMIARDFEAPADLNSDNIYEVTLVATDDDGNSDTEAFTVSVNDVIETATYTIDPISDTNVDENAPFTSVTPTLAGASPIGSVTYTLAGNDAGLFTVNSSTGVVSMVARDFESPADLNGDNVYEVTLVATDDDGNSDTEAFTVTVNDVIETAAYTIDPISDTNVDENDPFTSVTPTLAGAAPIGSVTYTLAGNDAGLFTVDSNTGVVSMIARDFESPADLNGDNIYEVTLVATDDDGNSDTEAFTVSVNDVVETTTYTIDPIADTNVDENDPFTSVTPTLAGAAPIGSVTYTLSGNDAGLFTVDSSTGVVSMISRDFESPADLNGDNVYEVTLVATDDDGNSDTEAFTVSVNDVIEAAAYTIDPIADTNVDENDTFTSVTPTLAGAAPIGSVTYTLSGNDAGLFTVDSSTGVVSMIARDFEAPADLNGDNVYEVTLVATDDDGNSNAEAFTVTVNDVIETATYTIDPIADTSVDENDPFTSVTPALSGAAPIGSVTYTLSGNDAGLFTVDSSTGVVSMVARDFESPADLNGDNVYEVTLVATDDDGNSDTEAFTVTVNDVIETATYTIDPISDTNVDENDPFTSVTPTLAGAAPIGSVTYSLSGNDAGLFTVDSSTGVVSMVARDFESPADLNGDNVYEVTLVATDDDGNSDTEAFTVTVNDVIETATYTIDPISDTNVDENAAFTSVTPALSGATPIGSVTYTLAGNDAGLFTVDSSTGVVSMIARDFESPADLNGDNVYEVTLVATDDDGNSDSEAFTVTVNDVVETAAYTIDPIADTNVDENAAFTSVTPTLAGAAPIGSVTYTLAGNDAGLFTVDSSTGVVSMIARDFESPADLNGDNIYEVTLVAADDDGNSDTEAFTVTVNDVVETVTYTIDPIADTNVDENDPFTSVTPTLAGAAPIGSVTYTLSGNDAGLFTVNSSTGVVSMIARDFESPADLNGDNVYEVTLVATDDDGNSDTEAFTVSVNDVVETATYTIDPITDTNVNENDPFTSVTPALSGAAPIGSVTYTLAGNDAGLFTVDSSTGVVSMIARDFEAPADLNGDNVYEVTLMATDDDGNSDTEAFTVTVNDVIETAAYTIDPISDTNVDENAPFSSVTPALSGAAPIGSVTYTLAGNDAGLFTVDSNTGVVSMVARDFESPADLNGDNIYEVTLVATDDDGNSDTEAFTVTVNDVIETATYTVDPVADTNVDENDPFTSVTPSLSGAAPIGSVTYSLTGNDAGLFTVNSSTGVVSMIARDFESPADLNGDNIYEVTLVATDNDGNSDTEAFTVTVNDVIETATYTIDPIADTSVDENDPFTSITPALSGAAPIGSVTYTLAGNDAGLFTVDSSTGVVSMIVRDFEAPADLNGDNVYEVTLMATDDDGNSDTEAFTVTVNDVIETATYTIDPISDTNVDENDPFTSITPALSGAAPIGSVTYTLAGNDAGLFTVDSSTGVVSMVARDFESPADLNGDNVYEVTLVATDDDGNSDTEAFTVTVNDVIETAAYTIDPIADTNVDENDPFTSVTPALSGAAPIGSVTYTLAGNDAGLFTVDSSTGVVSMIARDFESPADLNGDNVYEVTLVATDGDGNSDTEAFTVSVNDVIETAAYTIDPIADTNVDENDPFTSVTPALSGAAPIGSVTYTLSGNDAGLFTVDSSTGVVSMIARDFEAPADLNGDNVYEVTLVATDDDGNSDTEAFTVTVNDVIETATYTIDPISDTNVDENAPFTSVTPTLAGATPIGSVSYTISGNDAGLFTVDSSTGVVSMVARDFESPADLNGDNVYEVTLVATDDDGNSDTEAFTVSVNDVIETATYTIDPISDTNVDENAPFTSVTPALSGAAPIGSVTYSLSGNDAGLFTVDSNTGVVSMIARDFESPADLNGDNVYEVTIVATDDDGNSDTEAFTVTVNDVIEAAAYTIDPISDTSVDENDPFTSVTPELSGAAPIGSVTYTLAGNDAGLFTVDSSTGVVSMVARDFESPADLNGDNIYEVTLVATDDDGNSDTEAFTVTVNDVIETATYTIDPISDTNVDENAPFTSVTPTLAGAAPIGSVTYTLSGNDAGLFTVDSSTGVVSMVARDFESPADLNGDNVYEVTLVATDNDGNSDTEAFTVTVNDVVETATYTIDPISDTNVDENAPFTSVTPALSGAAPIGSVTYSLSGNDAGLFTVDSSTGVVSMVARDFESPADLNGDNVYEVTLVATDDDGNSDTEAFTVSVNDVIETAAYTIDPIADTNVDENALFTSVTPALSGAAPIGSVTYSLSGNDAGLFTVDSSTGVVSMVARDFESPADLNGDNVYEVTLVATDDDGNSDTEAFTVSVNDVIETAAYTIDPISDTNVDENALFTSVTPALSGAAPIGSVTYTLAGNDAGLFTVNSSTGVVSMIARDFESPADLNGDNVYEVTLVATDDDGNSDTEAFTVSVNDVIETAAYTIDPIADTNVDENDPFTSVTPTLAGASPIGSVTYTLSGNDAGLFTVDSSTGVVSMVARDFESPADLNGDNIYEVTLVATDDDGNSDTEAFTVTVNDVIETAAYTIDPISDTNVDENDPFTSVTPALSGAAPIGSVTYTLTGNDAGLFTVDSSTGVVSMVARDFEAPADLNGDNVYEVTLVATDDDGNSDTEAFTVTVNDVIETATYTIDPISDTNVDENDPFTSVTPTLAGAAPIGSVTYTLAGNDAGLFTVDSSTGVVSMIARDFEAPADLNGDNVYEVTLVATDDDGNRDAEAFTVTVNDVIETATYTIDPIADTSVDENEPFTSVTPSLSGASPIGSVTYTLSGNDAGLFTVDSTTGVVSMAERDFESPADFNDDNIYEVTLVATDDDGNSDTESFTVSVNEVNETAVGTVTDNDITPNTVSENASPGTVVGITGLATDPDATDSVTYSLSNDAGGLFTIDNNTGVVSVANELDYEAQTSHIVIITATSTDGSTSSESFTINIIQEDDTLPTVVNQSLTVAEGSTNTVLTSEDLQSTDIDSADPSLLYRVSDVGNGSLTINGRAWEASSNDTFSQQDIIDGNILYSHDGTNTSSDSFSYTVEDPAGNQLTGQDFAITVIPVDDPAVITGDVSYSGTEGDTVTGYLTATDLDGLTDNSYFTVSSDALNGIAAIDAKSGEWSFTPYDPNWVGSDSFTIKVTDDIGGTTEKTVNIRLNQDLNKIPVEQDVVETNSATDADAQELPPPEAQATEEVSKISDGSQQDETNESHTKHFIAGIDISTIIGDTEVNNDIMMPLDKNVNQLPNQLPLESVLADRYSQSIPEETVYALEELPQLKFIDLQNLDIAPLDNQTIDMNGLNDSDNIVSLFNDLDSMRNNLDQSFITEEAKSMNITEVVIGVTFPVVAGVVASVLRAGTLLTSFLSVAPVWKQFDIMPIVGTKNIPNKVDGGLANQAKEGDSPENSADTFSLDENIFNSDNTKR